MTGAHLCVRLKPFFTATVNRQIYLIHLISQPVLLVCPIARIASSELIANYVHLVMNIIW